MKKATPKKKRGRGRPATGRDPTMSLRMPAEIRARAELLSKQEGLTLSKAILQVLERYLPKKG